MPELTMEQLFEEAEANGLWFFTAYQQLWFSPAELKAEREAGRFRWGPENWQLRNPLEGLEQLQREVEKAQHDLESFEERMKAQEVDHA